MAANDPIKQYNPTTTQWEGIKAGAISDGTNVISTTEIGTLSTLQTTVKTNLVGAINEVKSTTSPRAATLVVAASNSTAAGKAAADYVCTGTNDHTTINNAITALGVNAGKALLLEGLFAIAGAISLPSNVSLEGQGNSTVLKIPNANNTSFNVIQNADSTNGNTGISISNLKIDGNIANNTTGTQHGISITKVTYSTVQNVTVINMRTYGILLNPSANYNTITGNTCQGNVNGINLSYPSNNNTIIGNTCQGNSTSGIYLNGSSNNTIIGNNCQGNGQFGIYLSNSNNNNTITGNTCQGNGTFGISLYVSSNNTITGNMCLENSQTTHNNSDNIFLSGASNTNNIQGNTCRQGALTNKPRYGIRVDVSACTGNLVTNNDLTTGGATGALIDFGTGTITTAGNKLT